MSLACLDRYSINSMAVTRMLLSVCLFMGSFSLARGQTNLVFGVYRELWTNLNPNVGGLAALTSHAKVPLLGPPGGSLDRFSTVGFRCVAAIAAPPPSGT